MKSLRGSRTEQNILTAFAGESQARNRYDYFGSQARKDGYLQIAHVFEETALHEKAHAKRLFKFLEGGEVTINAGYPAGVIDTTLNNLFAAAEGEHHEHEEMYPEFAAIARDEGFTEIAAVFKNIARAEMYHERRFLAFADNIEKNRVFQRPQTVVWRCRNCGYNHEHANAPDLCPACAHPTAHFELYAPEW